MAPRNFCILFRFSTTLTLNDEFLLKKRDVDNPARALESAKGLLHCPEIS